MKKRLPLIVLFLTSLMIVSCSRQMTDNRQVSNLIIYPSPPDTTRIQYLTSISNSLHITGKRNSFSQFVLGEKPIFPIVKPYGVAIHKGKIYVCDASIAGLEVIDLEKNSFSYFVPRGRGQLKTPSNCFVGSDGLLYVADAGRKQIVVFDDKGEYVDAFVDARVSKPTDVAVYGDKIFVPDAINNKVDVYNTANRQFLFSFPSGSENGDGHLFQPVNIAVTQDLVYVTDFGDFRVKSYTHDGTFQSAVGSFGTTPGQFVRPKGIALDRDDNLFVVDAGFENVQLFNRNGQLLMFFGGPYRGPGDLWLPAKVIVDYDNLSYFRKYVDPGFNLKYLIFVTSQYGPDKLNVYGAVEARK